MAGFAAGKLLSGLVLGAVVGASVALVLSSRSGVAVPMPRGAQSGGPTPFEPANVLIARARHGLDDFRAQIRDAVAEGKVTAAQTRAELNRRFEAAKRGEDDTPLA